MSCSLCRLPFTPSSISVRPRPIPESALTDKQKLHMKHAICVGLYIMGLVADMVYLDRNLFAINNTPGGLICNIVWETEGKTFIAFHTTCAALLRHRLGFTSNDAETLVDLAIIEKIVGPTMAGTHAGMLQDVNYKTALKYDGNPINVDIESLWYSKPDAAPGEADFDWIKWQQLGLEWTATRSDVFPRFRPQVPPARLSTLGPMPEESTTDIVTTQPLDVLHAILPYLDNKSFMHLLSTCRMLRHHALTTFQPHARDRVIALGWAVPVDHEYRGFVARNKSPADGKDGGDVDFAELAMAHATHSPMGADWHLYLSQVHRSAAMRARRWQWALAGELARVYREKKAAGPYADGVNEDGNVVKSKAWNEYAHTAKQQLSMRPVLYGMGLKSKGTKMPW
ncbi:hypothetical protein C8Q80DRAFT_1161847 [Daedaleopsis nitida]|nr:hypothetical protein C8Q80DRAFT_1161847 [Daedaleopsis nitida]